MNPARPATSAARQKHLPASRGTMVWLKGKLHSLPPGCFALIMATGIVSNAFYFEGNRQISGVLFFVNLAAFACLAAATLVRAICFGRVFLRDLFDPRQVFAFFSVVAATDVLGVGFHLRGFGSAALALWLFALVTWFSLIYLSFGVFTFLNTTRGADIVDGGWLIAIVATESLVILGTIVAPPLGQIGAAIFVLIHMLWGIGLVLYGIYITLFAYRIFFAEFEPEHITPLLWVVMGAAAISTNAGSTLILSKTALPFLQTMRPFIDGVTLIAWAWATWWIPMLVLFGLWKHGVRKVPIGYTPMLWSLVFPLGMYALASLRLSLAGDFPPLHAISVAMVWIALAAWLATAIAFASASWRDWRSFANTTS